MGIEEGSHQDVSTYLNDHTFVLGDDRPEQIAVMPRGPDHMT
jgi:hypothetical protein